MTAAAPLLLDAGEELRAAEGPDPPQPSPGELLKAPRGALQFSMISKCKDYNSTKNIFLYKIYIKNLSFTADLLSGHIWRG